MIFSIFQKKIICLPYPGFGLTFSNWKSQILIFVSHFSLFRFCAPAPALPPSSSGGGGRQVIFLKYMKISYQKAKLSKYELVTPSNGEVRSVWTFGSKMIQILDLVELGGLIWASWDWILHRFWTIWPCSGPLARFGGPLRPQNHKRDVYRAFLRDLWQRERVWVSLWGQLRKICIYEMKPLT